MRRSITLVFIAMALCQAAEAAEIPGSAIVSRLLAAYERQDAAAFQALVADDALIAAYDVGSPLTIDRLPMKQLGCVFTGLKPGKIVPLLDGHRYVVVDGLWNCPNAAGTPGVHPVTISFMVGGEKVKGVAIGGLSHDGITPPNSSNGKSARRARSGR